MNHLRRLIIALSVCSLLGVTSGVLADSTADQERLRALQEVVASLGEPQTHSTPAAAEMCWTPTGEFSAVGVASTVHYGPIGLGAQWTCGPAGVGKQIKAVWRYNKSADVLTVGDCPMPSGATAVANGFVKRDGPLQPGVYEVAFVADGATLASGKITIQQPMNVGGRKIDEVYLEALKAADTAVKEIDASHAQPAAKAALKALPLIGAVMHARPKDKDAMAVYDLVEAIVAIGKMDELAPKNAAGQVLDWATRSFAHATLSAATAQDATLKAKAQQYADTLEKAIPQMAEAAGKSR